MKKENILNYILPNQQTNERIKILKCVRGILLIRMHDVYKKVLLSISFSKIFHQW